MCLLHLIYSNNIHYSSVNGFSQIRLGVSGASGASNVRLVGIEPSQAASDFAIVLRDGSVWGENAAVKLCQDHLRSGSGRDHEVKRRRGRRRSKR